MPFRYVEFAINAISYPRFPLWCHCISNAGNAQLLSVNWMFWPTTGLGVHVIT